MIQENPLARPTIEIISVLEGVPASIQTALDRMNAIVSRRVPGSDPGTVTPDARIILPHGHEGEFVETHPDFWRQCAGQPCATLVISKTPPLESSLNRFPAGLPVSFIEDATVEELIGRLAAMCAFKPSLRHYEDELENVRLRDPIAPPSHWLQELQLAAEVQRDLLPNPTLDFGSIHVETLFRPADDLSGDIYDLRPLDEDRLGIAIADATGHGLPAALLTLFVKRAFRGKEFNEDGEQLVPPEKVLSRINRELCDANLSQCQYVTGLFACYDRATESLSWARGGSPYPILIHEDRPPESLVSTGGLMGALAVQAYEPRTLQLHPGQSMILHTDGLDAILLHDGRQVLGDDLTQTDWFKTLRTDNLADHLDQIRHRLDQTPDHRWPKDDVTILTLSHNA